MTRSSPLLRLASAVALACAFSAPALADQPSGTPDKDTLPGVTGSHSIVAPEPEPLEAPTMGDGSTFRVGNWDVRVSGSISFEIGTGTSHEGGHLRR